jgi:hypothetical protein
MERVCARSSRLAACGAALLSPASPDKMMSLRQMRGVQGVAVRQQGLALHPVPTTWRSAGRRHDGILLCNSVQHDAGSAGSAQVAASDCSATSSGDVKWVPARQVWTGKPAKLNQGQRMGPAADEGPQEEGVPQPRIGHLSPHSASPPADLKLLSMAAFSALLAFPFGGWGRLLVHIRCAQLPSEACGSLPYTRVCVCV